MHGLPGRGYGHSSGSTAATTWPDPWPGTNTRVISPWAASLSSSCQTCASEASSPSRLNRSYMVVLFTSLSGFGHSSQIAAMTLSRSPGRAMTSLLSSKYPTPPRPLYGLLSPSRSGVGLCLLRLLVDRLRRFSRLSEGLQLRLKSRRPLLCHLTACTFGAEFFPDLSQLAHKRP